MIKGRYKGWVDGEWEGFNVSMGIRCEALKVVGI
jgi:hypothetical protein